MRPQFFLCLLLTLQVSVGSSNPATADDPATIDFNRDVRPILSNHCWSCHGRDEASRKAGLRLDTRDAALAAGDSGRPAVVPGQHSASELVRRILSSDAAEVMPPPELQKPLTEQQQQILQRWIQQGAAYAEHWAFKIGRAHV